CCPGNCTHVWNYAQSAAFLFPELERNMRETNYLHDTKWNGYQSFRAIVPLGDYMMHAVATDGQLGTIMRAYREWKFSGDNAWLAGLWPKIKAALEFTWKGAGPVRPGYEWMRNAEVPWDPGKEGVIRGDQPNTYDIDFFGPNMLTGSLYLGALKAASEMAVAMGETEKAEAYLSLAEKGREAYENLLWNGSYYEQKVEVIDGVHIPGRLKSPGEGLPKYQFGKGCLSDQLLGQFLADVTGLGNLLDSAHINRALQSIYNHNFVKSFRDFDNVQRVYALNDESGLLLCSWPEGGKPLLPFVYSDEVWTGVEYQVASSLIWHGQVDEGLEVARAVRNRYRGYNRNPLGEIESGRYYARSMSSWALLNALSGYKFDGVAKSLGFDPRINRDDFFTFWSTGTAWGSFSIKNKAVKLKVEYGQLPLKLFAFTYPSAKGVLEKPEKATAVIVKGNSIEVSFKDGFRLNRGQSIVLAVSGG
ncbi:MAG TPA: GH116 family glycosyl hydrolase, partial [Bacteroidales bacterium]|nr:GH116 family glycosyl hydrolase [Bacteroidales bacterium]